MRTENINIYANVDPSSNATFVVEKKGVLCVSWKTSKIGIHGTVSFHT